MSPRALSLLALAASLAAPAMAATPAELLTIANQRGLPAAIQAVEEARVPLSVRARLLGHLHLRARDAASARLHLRSALDADPGQDAAWLELALAEHLLGNPEASLRALERGRRLGQSRPTFYVLSAQNLRALQDPSGAHRLLEAGLARFSEDLALLRARLDLELSLGLRASCEPLIAALLEESPDSPLERRWIAQRLVEAGAPSRGAALLEAARASAPHDSEVAAELAWAYARASAPRAAAEAIDPARIHDVRFAFECAEQYRAAGALKEALRVNQYVADRAKHSSQRAIILVELGRLDQARASVRTTPPSKLSDAARFALAFAATYSGAPAEAVAWLEQIEDATPFPDVPRLREALEGARR